MCITEDLEQDPALTSSFSLSGNYLDLVETEEMGKEDSSFSLTVLEVNAGLQFTGCELRYFVNAAQRDLQD